MSSLNPRLLLVLAPVLSMYSIHEHTVLESDSPRVSLSMSMTGELLKPSDPPSFFQKTLF